ncbi:MAG: LytTR family transcriptional regulator, partial [Ruminiclostridium sp.]|nr:LytTR family transcriptional regulator [Ruminiclostridium sp.]
FTLGNIEAEYVRTSPATCEVMLMYVVTGHYPNGDVIPAFQRLQFSWGDVTYTDEDGKRKRVPKIFMVHISHPIEYHKDDYLYPDHYNELYKNAKTSVQEPRISLLGTDGAFYVVTLGSVIWIESTSEHRCILHLRDKTITVRCSLSDLEKQTEGTLIRVHSSYIINPLDVRAVRRFKVELSDGSVIPIPEKKYTAVKKKLLGE